MDDSSVHLSCQHIIDAGYVVNEKTLVYGSQELSGETFINISSKLRDLFSHGSASANKTNNNSYSMIIYNTSTKQVYLVWL